MDDGNLSSVVGCLHLGEVDNVPAHRGSSNEASICEVGELVAVGIGALLLLAAPVGSGSLGAVEGTVEINGDDIAVVVDGTVDHGALGPGNTGVSNKDIEAAIEVLDDVIDSLLDGVCIGDLNLISLGCERNRVRIMWSQSHCVYPLRTLDTVLFSDLGSPLDALSIAIVPHGHIGTSLGQTLSNGQTDTGTSTGNNGSLSLEGEHAHEAGMLRSSGVVVDKESIFGNRVSSHCSSRRVDREKSESERGQMQGRETLYLKLARGNSRKPKVIDGE